MKKISLSILLSFLFFTNINANEKTIDLKNAIIETPNQVKSKDQYQEEENLLDKPPLERKILEKKKEEAISFDANVDINKEQKALDGVKVNLGTKF